MIKNLLNSPGIIFYFSKQTIGRWRYRLSSVFYTLIKYVRVRVISEMSGNKCIMPSSRKSHIEITGKEQALSSSAELASKQKSLLYFRMQ